MGPPVDSPMEIGKSEANLKNSKHLWGCAFDSELKRAYVLDR